MKLKKYSKYKNSGIDWIGEIPEEWEVNKLKYLLDIPVTDGPHETPEFLDEGIPFLSVDSIQNGEIIFDNCRNISLSDYKKYKVKCNPRKNDVFMGKAASIGKIARVKVDFPFCIWSPLALLRVNKKVTPYFFEYSLKSDYIQDQIEVLSTSNTQKNISMGDIPRIILVNPPIEKQQKISSFLDSKTIQIEKLIEKDKNLIGLLKEKRVSLINQAITKGEDWKLNKFKHLFNFSKGLNITKENLEDEGIPCVNYGEIHSKFGFELDPEINLLKCVSEDYLKISRKSLLKKGDFIFADTSEDLEGSGNFTYLNSDVKTFAGYHTVIARHIGTINHRFFAYFFDSELFRSQIRKIVKGVKVYSITNSILNDTLIWYPEKTLQDEIVDFLDKETGKIDTHIKKVERRIELYEEYKKSLIYNVVTGKVEV